MIIRAALWGNIQYNFHLIYKFVFWLFKSEFFKFFTLLYFFYWITTYVQLLVWINTAVANSLICRLKLLASQKTWDFLRFVDYLVNAWNFLNELRWTLKSFVKIHLRFTFSLEIKWKFCSFTDLTVYTYISSHLLNYKFANW